MHWGILLRTDYFRGAPAALVAMRTPGDKPFDAIGVVSWQFGVLAVLAIGAVGGWLVAQGRLVLGAVAVIVAVGVIGMLWKARSDATRDAMDRVRKFVAEIIWWLPH